MDIGPTLTLFSLAISSAVLASQGTEAATSVASPLNFTDDPVGAAHAAIAVGDYRLAGWGTASFPAPNGIGEASISPFGLRCLHLPKNSFRHVYLKSDAIDRDAQTKYSKQITFMQQYNLIIFKSGHLPNSWSCRPDM